MPMPPEDARAEKMQDRLSARNFAFFPTGLSAGYTLIESS